VANIFRTRVYKENDKSKKRVVVNVGGARSSKSYSLAQLFLAKFLIEKNKVFGISRKTFPALRMTTYRLMLKLISEWGVERYIEHNKSEHTITHKTNGNVLFFFSLDDPEKIKSSEFNYLWLEEASEFTYDDFFILKTRLSAPSAGGRNYMALSLNPNDYNGWIPQRVVNALDAEVIKSTYKDNPFLDNDYIDILESSKEQDPNYHRIYALGEWGTLEHLILPNFTPIDNFNHTEFDAVFYGLDFGFNAPTALVKVGLKENTITAQELIYEPKLTNSDLIAKMRELNIDASAEIYADAAEPNRIEEITRAGFNIFPADKDVNKGIDCLKSMKIFITKDSDNFIKELRRYSWQVDRAGNVIDKPVKVDDHCFIAGTKVLTSAGEKNIEQIKKGDLVYTPLGFKPVIKKHILPNKSVHGFMLAGRKLVCTDDHKVFTFNRGYVEANDLTLRDILDTMCIKNIWGFLCALAKMKGKKLFTTGLPLGGILTLSKIDILGRIADMSEKAFTPCIDTNIKKNLGLFLKIMTSTTKTAIISITIFPIWLLLRVVSICLLTLKSGIQKIRTLAKNIFPKLGLRRVLGMDLLPELVGTKNTLKKTTLDISEKKEYVAFARKSIWLKHTLKNFAQTLANLLKGVDRKLTSYLLSVAFAAKLSLKKNTEKKSGAVVCTQEQYGGLLYDLEVMDAHCYYANGILVHNCADSLRYGVFSYWKKYLNRAGVELEWA
jgi:phage terminase large subunit